MKQNQNNIDRLTQKGIKPSLHRIAILEWLTAHPVHPKADDIYAALSPDMPTLSKTTVYNTLKTFADAGIILTLNLDEKNQHFDGTVLPHAHFICTRCGAIRDVFFSGDTLSHLTETTIAPDLSDLDIRKAEISYYGLCPKCRTEQKNS